MSVVGTGADWWNRETNRYAGCTCPAARYSPIYGKPTNPRCRLHGYGSERD